MATITAVTRGGAIGSNEAVIISRDSINTWRSYGHTAVKKCVGTVAEAGESPTKQGDRKSSKTFEYAVSNISEISSCAGGERHIIIYLFQ